MSIVAKLGRGGIAGTGASGVSGLLPVGLGVETFLAAL